MSSSAYLSESANKADIHAEHGYRRISLARIDRPGEIVTVLAKNYDGALSAYARLVGFDSFRDMYEQAGIDGRVFFEVPACESPISDVLAVVK